MATEEDGESLDKAKGLPNKLQRTAQLQKIPEDLVTTDADDAAMQISADVDKKVISYWLLFN